jgi:glycosyltransferase involved in cell wall biosynthesis
VVSNREGDLLRATLPGVPPVSVLPNAITLPLAPVQGVRQPYRLMFNGTLRYHANLDAMVWFLEQVYPRVRAALPEVELYITGDHGQLPLPAQPGVCRTGVVSDVHAALAAASVAIVPLRIGGGTRFKILDAWAARTPVIATRKGAEGLDAVGGKHLLIADTPQEFAAAIVRVVQHRSLAEQLAQAGWELVHSRYDARLVGSQFTALVEQLARWRGSDAPSD